MTSTRHDASLPSCRSPRASALLLVVMAATVAASLSGCMRAGANTTPPASVTRVGEPQVHTLVAIEKKTADGKTVEVPLAEEYRAIRPAEATPAIPPSETWPAQ